MDRWLENQRLMLLPPPNHEISAMRRISSSEQPQHSASSACVKAAPGGQTTCRTSNARSISFVDFGESHGSRSQPAPRLEKGVAPDFFIQHGSRDQPAYAATLSPPPLLARRILQKAQASKAREAYGRLGMAVPATNRQNTDAARRLSELLNQPDAGEISDGQQIAPGLHDVRGKKVYVLDNAAGGAGSEQAAYVNYLVGRLTEFRKAGAGFGQKFTSQISPQITRRIAESQLKCRLNDAGRFDEVRAYLQAKIDGTILGKRNSAKGAPNYHAFASAPAVEMEAKS